MIFDSGGSWWDGCNGHGLPLVSLRLSQANAWAHGRDLMGPCGTRGSYKISLHTHALLQGHL